jgi:hypothetical protein
MFGHSFCHALTISKKKSIARPSKDLLTICRIWKFLGMKEPGCMLSSLDNAHGWRGIPFPPHLFRSLSGRKWPPRLDYEDPPHALIDTGSPC